MLVRPQAMSQTMAISCSKIQVLHQSQLQESSNRHARSNGQPKEANRLMHLWRAEENHKTEGGQQTWQARWTWAYIFECLLRLTGAIACCQTAENASCAKLKN